MTARAPGQARSAALAAAWQGKCYQPCCRLQPGLAAAAGWALAAHPGDKGRSVKSAAGVQHSTATSGAPMPRRGCTAVGPYAHPARWPAGAPPCLQAEQLKAKSPAAIVSVKARQVGAASQKRWMGGTTWVLGSPSSRLTRPRMPGWHGGCVPRPCCGRLIPAGQPGGCLPARRVDRRRRLLLTADL